MKNKKTVVIARYSEDPSWINEIVGCDIVIYNKGRDDIDKVKLKEWEIHQLPNLGREGHTYLHHIVSNWDKLNGLIFFTQASVSDNRDPFYPNIDDGFLEAMVYGFSAPRYHIYTCEDWSRPPIHGKGNGKHDVALKTGAMLSTNESMVEFATRHLGKLPVISTVSYCGCFIVRSDIIKSRPLEFYKNLLNEMSAHQNPLIGHYLERLWCLIFTKSSFLDCSTKRLIDNIPSRFQSCFEKSFPLF